MARTIVHTDALEVAAEIINAAAAFGISADVAATMPATWGQGVRLINNPTTRLLGYTLLLTALAETPGAAQGLIEALILSLRGNPGVPSAVAVLVAA
ncbi:MAG TPA: hypothetical protein VLA19_00510 [Herpetosiphonaceae bacterium]|nr:hypothetical protein [Herpetosiphonaceae bacterium]